MDQTESHPIPAVPSGGGITPSTPSTATTHAAVRQLARTTRHCLAVTGVMEIGAGRSWSGGEPRRKSTSSSWTRLSARHLSCRHHHSGTHLRNYSTTPEVDLQLYQWVVIVSYARIQPTHAARDHHYYLADQLRRSPNTTAASVRRASDSFARCRRESGHLTRCQQELPDTEVARVGLAIIVHRVRTTRLTIADLRSRAAACEVGTVGCTSDLSIYQSIRTT